LFYLIKKQLLKLLQFKTQKHRKKKINRNLKTKTNKTNKTNKENKEKQAQIKVQNMNYTIHIYRIKIKKKN
jgi:hypothetical protein